MVTVFKDFFSTLKHDSAFILRSFTNAWNCIYTNTPVHSTKWYIIHHCYLKEYLLNLHSPVRVQIENNFCKTQDSVIFHQSLYQNIVYVNHIKNLHAEDITKHMYMYLLKMLNVNYPSE